MKIGEHVSEISSLAFGQARYLPVGFLHSCCIDIVLAYLPSSVSILER